VNRLFRATDGAVWVGTDGGLFRMTAGPDGRPAFARVGLHLRGHPDEMVQVWSFAGDREGALWVGTRFGLVAILRGGRIVSYPVRQELETDHVLSLLYTPEDDVLWIGHQSGLAIFKPPPAASYSAGGTVDQPLEDRSIVHAAARRLKMQNGPAALPHAPGEAVYFETSRPGGFIALRDGGIARYDGRGFRVLSHADGLPAGNIGGAFADRAGKLWCWSALGVYRIEDLSAARLQPTMVAPSGRAPGGAVGALVEDARGSLYMASGGGIARIDHASTLGSGNPRIAGLYTTSDGLAGNEVTSRPPRENAAPAGAGRVSSARCSRTLDRILCRSCAPRSAHSS